MLTIILLCIIILIFALDYWIHNNSFAKALRKIPGPPLTFFFGNSLDLLVHPVKQFNISRQRAAIYNGIYTFYMFFNGGVEIYNPDDIEVITSSMKYHEKGSLYTFVKQWLRGGLLLSNGPRWKKHRKILTSAFHFNVLQKYFPAIEDNTKRLVRELEKCNGEPVDLITYLSNYTLSAICETAMGTPLHEADAEEVQSYKDAIYRLGKSTIKRIGNPFLHPDIVFKNTAFGKTYLNDLKTVHNFSVKMIKRRKQSLDVSTNQNVESEYYGQKKREAMLDMLLAAERDGLIDKSTVEEEVDNFTFAGHDTTAAGLTYLLMSLANETDVQEKVVEELDSIFGGDMRPATLEDLTNMRYLERCIKESLRLYPPVPLIGRRIPEDITLSGYRIPAGSQCHIQIMDLHRQEHLFPNPLKFDPDRFLPENSVGRHNYAYIPFSAGPRNCVGQKFAYMEMKLAVSYVLRAFKILPVTRHEDLCFAADIVLRSSEPVYAKFVKR